MKSFFKIYLAAGLIYYKKSIVADLGCNFLEDTADRKKTVTEFKSQIFHKCQPPSSLILQMDVLWEQPSTDHKVEDHVCRGPSAVSALSMLRAGPIHVVVTRWYLSQPLQRELTILRSHYTQIQFFS